MGTGVLLLNGSYYGTLAAARLFSQAGLTVVLADSTPWTITRYSRATQQFVECPPFEDLSVFAKWLIEYGQKNPGLILYPTSDDLCWVIAKYWDQLIKVYKFNYPEFSVIKNIIDKSALYQFAATVGIDAPPSFDGSEILGAEDPRLKYPLILKPRMQTGQLSKVKGVVVETAAHFSQSMAEFKRRVVFDSSVISDIPDVAEPLIQQFYRSAKSNTYSLAGYLSEDRQVFLVQASHKVLQNPPVIGVGLCFESAPVDEDIAAKIKKMCELIGYFGIFEVEFIREDGPESRWQLMDFNPRYYGQMQFEISRGLTLPIYLMREWQDPQDRPQPKKYDMDTKLYFRHGLMLRLLLTSQLIGGKLSFAKWKYWMHWVKQPAADPVYSAIDRRPSWVEVLNLFWAFFRHPRSSFKNFFR